MTLANYDQALQTMMSNDPEHIAQQVEEHIEVQGKPGSNTAAIRCRGNNPFTLTISVNEDRTLDAVGEHVRTSQLMLPDPSRQGEPSQEKFLSIKYSICRAARGLVASLTCALNNLEASTHNLRLLRSTHQEWTRKMPRHTANRIRGNSRHTQFENAVRQLLDPEAWAMAQDQNGKVHIQRYNRAVLNTQVLQGLSQTNPGASSWVVTQERRQPQAFQHPGEIVQEVKTRMTRAGVEPRYWKTVARMNPSTVQFLVKKNVPQYISAIIINAYGDLSINPDLEHAQAAMTLLACCRRKSDNIGPPKKDEPPLALRARQILRHIARLALRGNPPARNEPHYWITVGAQIDYICHRIDTDQDITATSYQGLARAAHQWHQAAAQERLAQELQRAIDAKEGWYDCWNSLVEGLDIPDPCDPRSPPITAVALTSAPDLAREGMQMHHCVGTYSGTCVNGSSRIFSLRQAGLILATTELNLRSGRWQPTQTRASKNHAPSESADQAARLLAQEYQRRWTAQQADGPRHTTWTTKQNTGATRPAQPARTR